MMHFHRWTKFYPEHNSVFISRVCLCGAVQSRGIYRGWYKNGHVIPDVAQKIIKFQHERIERRTLPASHKTRLREDLEEWVNIQTSEQKVKPDG